VPVKGAGLILKSESRFCVARPCWFCKGGFLFPIPFNGPGEPRERQASPSHFYSLPAIHYSLPSPLFHTFPQPYQTHHSPPNSLKPLHFRHADSNPPCQFE
jgi:hypothetical protein